MLRPRRGNGTALVEISNRGGKALTNIFDFAMHGGDLMAPGALGASFLLRQGFTLLWLGQEFDVPDEPRLLRATLPVATNLGKTVSGMIHSEWMGEKRQDIVPRGVSDHPNQKLGIAKIHTVAKFTLDI